MNRWLAKNRLGYHCVIALIAITAFLFGLPKSVDARTLDNPYPRLANIFYTPKLTISEAQGLARWDAVIISMENQYTSPDAIRLMRLINPDIIILAYMSSQELPDSMFEITDKNHPNYKLTHGLSSKWFLRDAQGGQVVFWPGTRMMNVTNAAARVNGLRWNTYLPEFVHENVMSTGLWDGIYYDNMWNDVSWLHSGNLDLNRDGQKESAAVLDRAWRDGMSAMLRYSRQLEGDEKIIVGGGGGQYFDSINGRLFEGFPTNLDGGWGGSMEKYLDAQDRAQAPSVIIINSSTTTGTSDDYRSLRYSLASVLLGNGFASFDFGMYRHADLWWYDEYDVSLGRPNGSAYNVQNAAAPITTAGVWRRDFTNGVVLINSTNTSQRVNLGAGYEKIKGKQAPTINTGEIVSSVTLPARDGLIVYKRQFEIAEGQYTNGWLAEAFSATGRKVRQGFFTYTTEYAGGVNIIKTDLTDNGTIETVVAWNNKVQVYNQAGFLIREFYPYGTSYNRGINLAVGDLDGDKKKEIVTGTGPGGGPHVRIFNARGGLVNVGFFAYDKNFRGGVHVAVGDMNGDGKDEIITGAGFGGGPHVRVFSRFGRPLSGFFAYDKNFRGGVSVASDDLNNDGKDEIITGAGPGGGPHVRIFNQFGKAVMAGFFAYKESWRSGITVTTADINRDNKPEIIVSSQTLY
ncbi:MAG: putative glycoside hydrolase [Patescibacteria group bacterium]